MHFLLPLLTGCLLGLICFASAMDPKFDPTTRMRLVLVPADAAVGSVIYRIRATDEEFDYPLQFDMVGDSASSTVQIETLPCTKYNSVCQANVLLKRRLEAGRYYDFQISVKDTKGNVAQQSCSITATNFTTPHDLLFPHKPAIIMIPEVRSVSILWLDFYPIQRQISKEIYSRQIDCLKLSYKLRASICLWIMDDLCTICADKLEDRPKSGSHLGLNNQQCKKWVN